MFAVIACESTTLPLTDNINGIPLPPGFSQDQPHVNIEKPCSAVISWPSLGGKL